MSSCREHEASGSSTSTSRARMLESARPRPVPETGCGVARPESGAAIAVRTKFRSRIRAAGDSEGGARRERSLPLLRPRLDLYSSATRGGGRGAFRRRLTTSARGVPSGLNNGARAGESPRPPRPPPRSIVFIAASRRCLGRDKIMRGYCRSPDPGPGNPRSDR